MAISARLPFAARRNEARLWTMRFEGLDLTSKTMRMQVRLYADAAGAPLLDLGTVTTGAAQGLKLQSVDVVEGVPVSTVSGRINKTSMDALPYGELGAETRFDYAIQLDGTTRLIGEFLALPAVVDANPFSAPGAGAYGSSSARAAFSSVAIKIALEEIISVKIDDVSIVAAFNEQASLSAIASALDADRSAISAATAESAAGPTYASTATGLADTIDGEPFAVANGDGTVSIYVNTSGVAVEQRTLATTLALAADTGGDLLGFILEEAAAQSRTMRSKMLETRSLLDFIPYALHAAIINGTSTADLTAYLQSSWDSIRPILIPYGTFNWEGEVVATQPIWFCGRGTRSLTSFNYRGSSGNALKLENVGTAPNSQFHTIQGIRLNNLGNCDSLLRNEAFQSDVSDLYIPTRLSGGNPCNVAVIDTCEDRTVIRQLYERIYIDSNPARPNPIGIKVRRGGQVIVRRTHLQDCAKGVEVGANGNVENFVFCDDSRTQTFGHTGLAGQNYSGLANATGLDIIDCGSLTVRDCTLYTNNNQTVGPNQRAIRLGVVSGGQIAANFFGGQGQATHAITVRSSSEARVISPDANTFYRYANDAIEVESGAYPWIEPRANTLSTCPRLIDRVHRWGCSGTYDPASLNDGQGVTASLSDTNMDGLTPRIPIFTNALQGIMLSAYQSANGQTAIRFQNESGATLDRSSAKLAVRAVVDDDIRWDTRLSVDPPSVASGAQYLLEDIPMPGAQLHDCVVAAFLNAQSGNLNGFVLDAYVSAPGRVSAIFYNGTTTNPRNLLAGALRLVGLARFRLSAFGAYGGGTIANGATAVLATITVPGAAIGDLMRCSFGQDRQGLIAWAETTGTDTVKVYGRNRTGVGVTLAADDIFVGALQ